MQFRKAAIVGVAAGLLGGLFGVGGGLIMVPGLIGVVKMERRRAHGTSLAATLPISLASLATYLAHGNVDWAVAFFITMGALAGAIVGTHLLHVIPKNVLVIVFVVTASPSCSSCASSDPSLARSSGSCNSYSRRELRQHVECPSFLRPTGLVMTDKWVKKHIRLTTWECFAFLYPTSINNCLSTSSHSAARSTQSMRMTCPCSSNWFREAGLHSRI